MPREPIRRQLQELLAKRAPNLKAQGGVWVWGQDFLFAAEADGAPRFPSTDSRRSRSRKSANSTVAYRVVKMRTGVTHSYQFYVDGKPLGARRDVAGYNPDSYPRPGVPKGTLSEKKTITSKIYDGATADYWVYASPGVDPARTVRADGVAGRPGHRRRRSLVATISSR